MSTTTPTPQTPTHYLSTTEVFASIGNNREVYIQKVRDGIKFKLQKTVSRDAVEEIVSDVMTDLLERVSLGRVQFTDEAKVTGYVLLTAWRRYRDQNVRAKSKTIDPTPDWELEGYQTYTQPSKQVDKNRQVSLDTLLSIMDSGSSAYYTESIMADTEGSETRSETDQDLTDAYYLELYTKLFQYLEDCITDDYLTFREVGIYKQYVINGYTMKEVVAQSDFSRTVCYDAIHKIKNHLKTVDWYLKPLE